MPVGCRFLAVDIMEKAAGDLLLFQVLPYTQIASLIVIDRMTRTLIITTGAEFFCAFHEFSLLV